jgi:hypothetical protein
MQPLYKFFLTVILCCFSWVFCSAQQTKAMTGIRFRSINQAGLLNGGYGSSWQLQTINGIQYRSWFGGIGVGLDDYRFRGIPLFADIRKTFGHSKNKVFVYGDGGIHFSWLTDKEKQNTGQINDWYSNGPYLDGGLGYQVQLGGKNALLLSVGYSYKYLRQESNQLYFMPNNYPGPFNSDPGAAVNTYHYQLNRISIKLGWAF